jgi:hypothetical protein
MRSFTTLGFIVVAFAGFALGALAKGDGVSVRIDGGSIVVDAGGDPSSLLVVGSSRPGKGQIEAGLSIKESPRLVLPREGLGRLVVYKLTPLSWCDSDVCEPCRPEDPYACTTKGEAPLFGPIFATLLEPPVPTLAPTEDPLDPTPTATATPTATSKPTPSPTS